MHSIKNKLIPNGERRNGCEEVQQVSWRQWSVQNYFVRSLRSTNISKGSQGIPTELG